MSEIRVDNIVSETGTGNVAFNKGVNVTGVVTATSFEGSVNATGLTGTPDIAVQNITGVAATFTGVLTYEDVTNVDSVGIVTARGGLEVGAAGVGGTISSGGNVIFAGITTVGAGLSLADSIKARFGTGGDLTISHNGSDSNILGSTGDLYIQNTGASADDINIRAQDDINLQVQNGESGINIIGSGTVELYHANSKKIETTATGVTVTGQLVGVTTGGTASGCSVGVGTTGTILQVTDGATQNSFAGILVEKASIQATNVTSGTIDLAQGNVHYFTTNGSGATAAAIKYKGGNNLSSYMKVGDNISVSVISKPNNSEYISSVTIDGSAVTEEWLGGSTPSEASGAASSYTITNINITRFAATGTPDNDYLVLVGVNNYA